MQYTLAELAVHIGAELKGDANLLINGIAPLQVAGRGDISLLDNPKYRKLLPATVAGAVILRQEDAGACPTAQLLVRDPYYAYAKAAELFVRERSVEPGIHPTAVVEPTARIDETAYIGPYAVIGAGTVIEASSIVGAHCYIGDRCFIGEGSRLRPRVSLYDDVKIGKNGRIHSGAVIGSDGFGLAKQAGRWHHIPQLGGVTLGDDVLVGANTTIDCGALKDTCIHRGVKIDNQVQIGHNVEIGENTAIAGCVGIAGSTRLGANCTIGGGAGLAGHITIADNITITAMAGVSRSLDKPGVYSSGFRVRPGSEWLRIVACVEDITSTLNRIKKLEQLVGMVPSNIMESK